VAIDVEELENAQDQDLREVAAGRNESPLDRAKATLKGYSDRLQQLQAEPEESWRARHGARLAQSGGTFGERFGLPAGQQQNPEAQIRASRNAELTNARNAYNTQRSVVADLEKEGRGGLNPYQQWQQGQSELRQKAQEAAKQAAYDKWVYDKAVSIATQNRLNVATATQMERDQALQSHREYEAAFKAWQPSWNQYMQDRRQAEMNARSLAGFERGVYGTGQGATTTQRGQDIRAETGLARTLASQAGQNIRSKQFAPPGTAQSLETLIRERWRAAGRTLPKDWHVPSEQVFLQSPETAAIQGGLLGSAMAGPREYMQPPQFRTAAELGWLPEYSGAPPPTFNSPYSTASIYGTAGQIGGYSGLSGIGPAGSVVPRPYGGASPTVGVPITNHPNQAQLAQIAEAAQKQGFDDDAVRAILAVAVTEGGMTVKLGDAGQSHGAFQFHAGGQLPAFARAAGIPPEEAAAMLQQQPLAGVDWALQNYLGSAVRRGQEMGLVGPDLATYAQRHGQVSVSPETAGANYNALFGEGTPATAAAAAQYPAAFGMDVPDPYLVAQGYDFLPPSLMGAPSGYGPPPSAYGGVPAMPNGWGAGMPYGPGAIPRNFTSRAEMESYCDENEDDPACD
jgi:hypothetical protein